MKKRLALWLIVGTLAVLIAVPLGAVYFLTCTEAGLQTLVRAVAARDGRIGSVTLQLEGVEGTLAGGFRARLVDVHHPRAHTRYQQVAGRIAIAPLFWQTIRVPELRLDTALIEVRARRANPGAPVRALRFLPSLLTIRTDAVRVRIATVVVPSGLSNDFLAVRSSGVLHSDLLRIYDGECDLLNMHLRASGEVTATTPIGLAGKLRLTFQLPEQPRWIADAQFDGDVESLALTGNITAPLRAQVAGTVADLLSGWHFTGNSQVQQLDISVFGGGTALGQITGELAIAASRDGYQARGTLNPAGLQTGPMHVDFDGAYAARVLTIRSAAAQHPASRARATTHGTVTLTAEGPRLALQGEWTQFRWPLPDPDPALHSAAGSYVLAGVKPYGMQARGELTVPLVPQSMQFEASTVLFNDHVRVDAGTLHALEGQIALRGEAVWSPQQSWSLTGSASGVNPVALRRDLPGSIGFDFAASGNAFAADADLDLVLQNLRGKLRGSSATGRGHALRSGPADDATWRFDNVDLSLGSAHLTLDGSIAAARDLRFTLTTSDLSLLDPDARGRIDARGELRGTDVTPVLRLVASGADFRYGNASLRTLDADINMDFAAGGTTKGNLRAHDLVYGERKVEDLNFMIDGTAEDHHATLRLQATRLSGVLDARGAMHDGIWRGQIVAVNAGDGAQLKLTSEGPAALSLARNEQHLEELCLRGSNARLCASGTLASSGWAVNLDATQLPMRTFTAGLSSDVDYDGTLDIHARVSAATNQNWIGTLRAQLQDAQLRHRLSNGRDERFALGTGKVEVNAVAGSIDAVVGLDAQQSGRIAGRLHAQRSSRSWQDFPVEGTLDLETDGLGLLDVYVDEIDRAAGRLTTRVDISGTLGAPQLQGALKLTGGEFDMYQVNFALRAVELNARFNASSLSFDGSAQAGDGTGKFAGQLDWRNREPFGTLHLEGEDLRIVNVPEARIQASPNLDFKFAGHRVDVTGEVKLPYARLEPADITNAVLPSGDEVLVGARPVDPEQRYQVTSNITLTLGERATIDTYGLSGRLAGSIKLRSDDTGITRGTGELGVVEGKYAAFGRKLDIERGRLLFNNGPVADPGVDIRAVKKFPDVTAGVNVRGTLRQPRMTFFSDPPVPQSQVVSLILGGSFESAQNGSRGAARNDLIAQGGAIIAQQFGSKVGIEDVSIESDLSNETSLVLGKYLSPRLYVSYGISLAEAINTVKLRYTIGDHWTIKTESGRARSADLVYTIQK